MMDFNQFVDSLYWQGFHCCLDDLTDEEYDALMEQYCDYEESCLKGI